MAASTAPFRIKSSTLLSFALFQLLFDFHHERIITLVKNNRGCGEKTRNRGNEAHHEANPGLYLAGLDYVGVETKIGQQPSSQGAADRPAQFLGEGCRREDQSGRPSACLPLRVVGGIRVKSPQQGRGGRKQGRNQQMNYKDQDDLLAGNEIKQD